MDINLPYDLGWLSKIDRRSRRTRAEYGNALTQLGDASRDRQKCNKSNLLLVLH